MSTTIGSSAISDVGIGGFKSDNSTLYDQSMHKKIAHVLDQCQASSISHAKLISHLQAVYKQKKCSEQVFFATFMLPVQNLMISMKASTPSNLIIDFVTRFAAQCNDDNSKTIIDKNKDKDKETKARQAETEDSTMLEHMEDETTEPNEEEENPFFLGMIHFMIENSRANCDAVRFRCCQILSKLMNAINNEHLIDEELYDEMCDALLGRLRDTNTRVQAQAIAAIYRLQDPNDRECRVTQALLFLLNYDPHWMIRYQALSHVAYSKVTLAEIILRVSDPFPLIRRRALEILSEKVLIKFISIERRLFILNHSLKDDDESVQNTACSRLLPSWLAVKENDLCKLMKALDVVDSTDLVELMLNKMSADHSCQTIVNDFSHLLETGDKDKEKKQNIIPLSKLDAESALYWFWVCETCAARGRGEGGAAGGLKTKEEDLNNELLDGLLPSLTEFTQYIREVMKRVDIDKTSSSQNNAIDNERAQIENAFVLKQLIRMLAHVDFSDQYGKKQLHALCHTILSDNHYCFLYESIVMNVYKLVQPSSQSRVNQVCELIWDIKEPHKKDEEETEENEAEKNNEAENMTLNDPTVIDESITENDEKEKEDQVPKMSVIQINYKISELKFKRMQLKESFDEIYKEGLGGDAPNLTKLHEIKSQIDECQAEMARHKEMLTPKTPIPIPTTPKPITPKPTEQMDTVEQQEELNEFDEEEKTYQCLQIAVCLLRDLDVKSLTPQLQALCDKLILPSIASTSEEVRAHAMRALNLFCILKLELAQKYVPLMLQATLTDVREIQIEAFKGVINSIMAFSLGRITDMTPSKQQLEAEGAATTLSDEQKVQLKADQDELGSKILTVLTDLLDHDDQLVSTFVVNGFCRLYMTGHIVSPKLFSKLLLLYYSPLTESNTEMRACLSKFLPTFSFFSAANQQCVEQSFMITLKCLINASSNSNYLSEIDLIKVVDSLIKFTNPRNLMQNKTSSSKSASSNSSQNVCHENIAKSLCYEILRGDDITFKSRTYVKIMLMCDVTDAHYLSLNELHELAEECVQHIGDRTVRRSCEKFAKEIKSLLEKTPEFQVEQAQKARDEQENATIVEERKEAGNKTTTATTTTATAGAEGGNASEKEEEADKSADPIAENSGFVKIKKNKTNKAKLLTGFNANNITTNDNNTTITNNPSTTSTTRSSRRNSTMALADSVAKQKATNADDDGGDKKESSVSSSDEDEDDDEDNENESEHENENKTKSTKSRILISKVKNNESKDDSSTTTTRTRRLSTRKSSQKSSLNVTSGSSGGGRATRSSSSSRRVTQPQQQKQQRKSTNDSSSKRSESAQAVSSKKTAKTVVKDTDDEDENETDDDDAETIPPQSPQTEEPPAKMARRIRKSVSTTSTKSNGISTDEVSASSDNGAGAKRSSSGSKKATVASAGSAKQQQQRKPTMSTRRSSSRLKK